ncbi:MAG: tetratricopeptide repeat protein, partial [Planctomycetes bacterium]|nr:tetratricopeptide repeat protein [Planctomycetota bacterium]
MEKQPIAHASTPKTDETNVLDDPSNALTENHRTPIDDRIDGKDEPLLVLPEPEVPNGNSVPPLDMATVAREASRYIELVVQLFPTDTDALEVQARLFLLLGKLESAKDCWEKSLGINPQYGYAYTGLGMIAMRESKYDEAVGHLKKGVALLPGEQNAAHELSNAYLRNGQIDQAIRVLQDQ